MRVSECPSPNTKADHVSMIGLHNCQFALRYFLELTTSRMLIFRFFSSFMNQV